MAAAAAEADPEPDAQEGLFCGKLRADALCSQFGGALVLYGYLACKPHLSPALALTL